MPHQTSPNAALFWKMEEMIKLLNIHLNHFPKHEKYGLCQQIRQTAYELYGMIVECEKKYHNKTSLQKLDILHEQLRMFVNLARTLGYYKYKGGKSEFTPTDELRRYTAISLQIDEIGAMIGGWLKSLRQAV